MCEKILCADALIKLYTRLDYRIFPNNIDKLRR